MALNLDILRSVVKEYGAPLYPSVPTTEAGSIAPGEYEFDAESNTVAVKTDAGVMYLPVRTGVIVHENSVLRVGIFTASRDAEGEYNGKHWSVEAGSTKAFVY